MDAAWTMKCFSAGKAPLELLSEREKVFKLLPQTTPGIVMYAHVCISVFLHLFGGDSDCGSVITEPTKLQGFLELFKMFMFTFHLNGNHT